MSPRKAIAKCPHCAPRDCTLTVLDAYRLYQLAVRCKSKALGLRCVKPLNLGQWCHEVDRRTFIMLAVELHRRGWRPHWH